MSKQDNMRSLNWRQRGWRSVGWKNSDVTVEAPADSILHWDADIDAFSEQTGGVHTFNHSVLSPQYQRNADGSYTDVGAKPAVDVFDGEKWLRSCGAVQNLLPSGAESISSDKWFRNDVSVIDDTVTMLAAGNFPTIRTANSFPVTVTPGQSYTFSFEAKRGTMTDAAYRVRDMTNNVDIIPHVSGNYYARINSTEYAVVSVTFVAPVGCTTIWVYTLSDLLVRQSIGNTMFIRNPIVTATPYPVPYVPPGVTQPASNATTTNGVWFALPDGSPLWQALTGQPLTLATRVRMGVGRGDVLIGYIGIVAEKATEDTVIQRSLKNVDGNTNIVMAKDGTNGASNGYNVPWPRNSIIRRVTQVNAAGTQFRVGYMIEGTHTTIQWSAWSNFDGSFNPSTLYRLMLGYNNAHPMWFNKITAWKKQVTDAEILEAMA